jgi:glycosyltransferase involved in cell wall biosynthesis
MPSVLVSLDKLKEPYSGLGQFSHDLGRALLRCADPDVEFSYLVPGNRRDLFQGDGVRLVDVRPYKKETIARLIRPAATLLGLAGDGSDLWHVPHQDAKYLPMDPRVPVLLTIHDLNYLRTRSPAKAASKTRRLQRKVDRATVLATDSEYSARDIRDHLDVGDKPLHVVYLGVPERAADATPPSPSPEVPFLFAIGLVCPAKNFHVLVEFMARVPEFRLMIAGGVHDPYADQLRDRIRASGLEERIRLLGPVTDEERQWLYRHCEAVLVPSLTEGFGLPVVEAMQEGKPVFMSRVTSLPEVGGSLGFYWDDYGPDHMAEVFRDGMSVVRDDASYSGRLEAHAAQFRWSETARRYIEIYKEMC